MTKKTLLEALEGYSDTSEVVLGITYLIDRREHLKMLPIGSKLDMSANNKLVLIPAVRIVGANGSWTLEGN